jgi:hypothetical protein
LLDCRTWKADTRAVHQVIESGNNPREIHAISTAGFFARWLIAIRRLQKLR